jgi:hypothetical protein
MNSTKKNRPAPNDWGDKFLTTEEAAKDPGILAAGGPTAALLQPAALRSLFVERGPRLGGRAAASPPENGGLKPMARQATSRFECGVFTVRCSNS